MTKKLFLIQIFLSNPNFNTEHVKSSRFFQDFCSKFKVFYEIFKFLVFPSKVTTMYCKLFCVISYRLYSKQGRWKSFYRTCCQFSSNHKGGNHNGGDIKIYYLLNDKMRSKGLVQRPCVRKPFGYQVIHKNSLTSCPGLSCVILTNNVVLIQL